MREKAPEHAHQLDAEWERMVLDNNRPWLTDQDLLHTTEDTRAQTRAAFPDAFATCGCDHRDTEAGQTPPRPRQEVRPNWSSAWPTPCPPGA
ncbi:hypothetical protein [Nocardiopsis synnemataformans]|uniref:hypothetical protein n=1 Tax=Nocardiopsis synnemataformans TaxID=61305 RepID=UPI003EBD832D